jgi:flagellar motor switch protein FliM
MTGSIKKGAVQPEAMKRYDPATQQRQLRERFQALDLINERFARNFRTNMFNMLGRSPDVTVGNVSYITSSQFEALTAHAMSYNMVSLKPLRGMALMSFPSTLVSKVIENLFGGDGRLSSEITHREFTPTEQRIVEKILGLCMESYKQAWSAVYPIKPEFVRSEIVCKFANIANSQTETLINTKFTMEIGSFEVDFHITFPFSMVEPIKSTLSNTVSEQYAEDPVEWNKRISTEIQDSQIELVSDFLYIDTSINDLVSLRVGDILPIELPAEIVGRIDDVPVMMCEYGNQNGRRALRVTKLINHILLNNKPSPRPVIGASTEVKDKKND